MEPKHQLHQADIFGPTELGPASMKMLRVLGIACAWLLLSAQSGEYDFEGTVDEAFEKTTVVIEASAYACHVGRARAA